MVEMTNEEIELLRFPGSVPGVLRRGSPVVYRSLSATLLMIDHEDGEVRFSYRPTIPNRKGTASDLSLDLTDATGRAHLAWWLGGGEPRAFGGWFANHTADLNDEGCIVRTIAAWMGRRSDGAWQRYQSEPTSTFRPPSTVIVPSLSGLDTNDQRLLPDGSRLVDALALSLVARHVAGVTNV